MDKTKKPILPTLVTGEQKTQTDEKPDSTNGPGPISTDRRMARLKADLLERLPATGWITKRFNWASLKPVFRSSLSAWICLLFMLISVPEQMLGQVSFLTTNIPQIHSNFRIRLAFWLL